MIDRSDAARRRTRLATNDLLPLVYVELRSLAARHLRDERVGHTLQSTALVHEAYMRLVGGDEAASWNSVSAHQNQG